MKISLLPDEEWDQALQTSLYSDFFQTSFWKNQVCSFIGGEGRLYLCEDHSKKWLVPCYLGSPWSKGFRIGSIGYGGPVPLHLMDDPIQESIAIREIVSSLEGLLKQSCTGVTTYPMKEWEKVEGQLLSKTQILPLRESSHAVFNEVMTGNVRTTIRRAEQTNLQVSKLVEPAELERAHRLLAETQVRVGAHYTTPFSFFSALAASEQVSVWSISDAEGMIAMSLMLDYAGKAFHLFHGWKRDLIPPGTNQLLMWKMVQHAIKKGCSSFNMGESHQESLRIAKQRWGAESIPILKMNGSSA